MEKVTEDKGREEGKEKTSEVNGAALEPIRVL